jgi:hypothetical protein
VWLGVYPPSSGTAGNLGLFLWPFGELYSWYGMILYGGR